MTHRSRFGDSLLAKQGVRGAIPWLAVSRIASMFMSIVTGILVARAIGPEGRGVIAALSLFAGAVFALGNLGVGQGVFFLQSRNEHTPAEGFTAIVVASGVVVVVLPFAIWAAAATGFVPAQLRANAEYATAAIMLAGGSFFTLLCYDLLRGLGRAQIPAVIPVVSQMPVALATLGVLLAGGRTAAIVWTNVLAMMLNAGLCVWVLARLGATGWRFSFHSVNDSVRFGWLLYLNGLIAFAFAGANQGIVLHRLGVKELGIFAVAVLVAELVSSVEAPVTAAAQYHLAERARGESILLCARLTRVVLAVLTVVAAGFLIAGPAMIRFGFGVNFSTAVLPFIVYLPSVVAVGVARPLATFLMYQLKRSDLVLATSTAGTFLNILLSLVLVSRWGLVGLAAAITTAQAAMLLVYVNRFQRASGLRLRTFLVATPDDYRLVSGPLLRRVATMWA